MNTRRIGSQQVGAVGLGAMHLSSSPDRPDPERATATVHAALDAGVTLIDTADVYCLDDTEIGHNERLVAAAVRAWSGSADDVVVATKGGLVRPGGGWDFRGTPEHLHAAARASARALGVEAIGLYQLHWPDPSVPYAESVGALGELVDAGIVRAVGVSNVDVAKLDTAAEVLGDRLVSVQNPYSVEDRWGEAMLRRADELGLAFLPYTPLAGVGGDGPRAVANRSVAAELGVSPQRVALAWLLARSPAVVVIPGSSRPESIRDSAAAAGLELAPEHLARITGAPAAPSRPVTFAH
ncbi:aldo/keto reductase [Trujillonella endophytica]|uniref:Predicted oxidoreductase n=1 Tax=Trujillonella endophytica TaxID=673521 RepID=A0A1H8UG98_9ACTN|nr:aldo/keto reductase [Trujillella endophytica]SEP01638.1 Predicted oxidoreductase [Trujillella endophytica]